VQQQERQQRALPRTGDRDGLRAGTDLERADDAELDSLDPPTLPEPLRGRYGAAIRLAQRPCQRRRRRPDDRRHGMFTTSSIKRPVVLGLALAALGASTAAAREADAPIVRAEPAAAQLSQDLRSPDAVTGQGTQQRLAPPRTEGMGVQPAVASAQAPAPVEATPLTTSGGGSDIDWLAIAIGGCAVLALGLAGAAVRSHRSHTPASTP
jgi:hypothetical protein